MNRTRIGEKENLEKNMPDLNLTEKKATEKSKIFGKLRGWCIIEIVANQKTYYRNFYRSVEPISLDVGLFF